MQIFGLHKNIYKLARYASTQELLDKQTQERRKILGDWEILKARAVPDDEIVEPHIIAVRKPYPNMAL